MRVVAFWLYNPSKHDNKVAMILYVADSSYCETRVTNWSPSSFATYSYLEEIGWVASVTKLEHVRLMKCRSHLHTSEFVCDI